MDILPVKRKLKKCYEREEKNFHAILLLRRYSNENGKKISCRRLKFYRRFLFVEEGYNFGECLGRIERTE